MQDQFSWDEKNGWAIFRLEGKLDIIVSPRLEEFINQVLKDKDVKGILIDFSRVNYLSSAGMRLLLFLKKRMENKKCSFGVFSMQENILNIINSAGFDKVLSIFSTEEEAVQS